jgi:predicted DNA-binding protein YlxM (UPF0122 family)
VVPPSADPSCASRRRHRPDWKSIEAAYVRGRDAGGQVHFPSLDEIAELFGVSRRQAAYHSRRSGWPQKRERYRTELALESHRRALKRRLDEGEKFDEATLTVAKVALNKVIQALQHLDQPGVHPPTLESLVRTVERAQKIARISTGLPSDLTEAAEKADERKRAMDSDYVAETDGDPLSRLLEKIEKLEGEEFLRAIDGLLGDTPAGKGKVIELKTLLDGKV